MYCDQLQTYVNARQNRIGRVYLNKGVNSDSQQQTLVPSRETNFWQFGAMVEEDDFTMHDVLAMARSLKTPDEVQVMRWAAKIACEAHISVLK